MNTKVRRAINSEMEAVCGMGRKPLIDNRALIIIEFFGLGEQVNGYSFYDYVS